MKTFAGPQTMEKLIEYDKKIGSTYREPHHKNIFYRPTKSVDERINEIFDKVEHRFRMHYPSDRLPMYENNKFFVLNEFGEVENYFGNDNSELLQGLWQQM